MSGFSHFSEAPMPLFSADEAITPEAPPRAQEGGQPSYIRDHRRRLRERFMVGGAGAMPDYELLELVLFRAIPRRDVKPLARHVLEQFGDFNGVLSAPPARLSTIAGVGDAVIALEESKDILALQSGEKFEVPFDTLAIFSTNFHPNKIFDQAALRRIFYKIKIDGPSQADFLKIFAMVARKKQIPLDEPSLVHLLKKKYAEIDNIYANYQPVFLIDQMISICEFEGIPYQMTPALIDRAWANMFVEESEIVN